MYSKKYIILILITALVCSIGGSCRKFISIDPPTNQIIGTEVFKDDATARAALTGIYAEMMNGRDQFTTHGISLYTSMSADELYYYSPGTKDEFVNNNLTGSNDATIATLFWTPAYRYIYWANTCIEQLERSNSLTPAVQKTLIGEAKFIRAFCYFNLVNLFGDVPLITSSDYTTSQFLPRSSKQAIYEQVIKDLEEAYSLLSLDAGTNTVRPGKWAASALLARVYLYQENWSEAEEWATKIIESGQYNLTQLQSVFLKDSKETIWQLQPVNPTRNTWEGNLILPASASSMPTYLLRSELINAFEPGDGRLTTWTKSRVYLSQTLYYPYKYKVQTGSNITEYYVVFRLGEQYLIRAEARLKQNNLQGAQDDVNVIRIRAGLLPLALYDPGAMSNAIEHEYFVEFFSEWGHRWFNLKRTGRATSIIGALKGNNWQETDQLYPIPQSQINANGALTQNPGY